MREHNTSLERYIRAIDKNNENLRQIIDKLKEDELVILKPPEENMLNDIFVIEIAKKPQRQYRMTYDRDFNSYLESFEFVYFTPEFHLRKIEEITEKYNATHDPEERFYIARRNVMVQNYRIDNYLDNYRVLCTTNKTKQHNSGEQR